MSNGRAPGPGQQALAFDVLFTEPAAPAPAQDDSATPERLRGKKAPRHRLPWTDDEESWLTLRYREGAHIWQIGLELGRSAPACHSRLYRLGEQRHTACARCEKPLQQTGEAGHPAIYCAQCVQILQYAAKPDQLTCPGCLQTFTPEINSTRNLYCSKKCTDAAWYAKVRAKREAARRRFGAVEGSVNDAQRAEVLRLSAAGASWREIETSVGVNRKQAKAVVRQQARVLAGSKVPATTTP